MKSTARQKFTEMTAKFARLMGILMSALKKKIAEKVLDLDTMKSRLSFRDPDHEKQFSAAQSVDDLLKVIRSDCAFTNPDPLEALIWMFDLHEERQEVEKYRNDLEKYYQEVSAEEFIKEGLVQYDKDANIEVSALYTYIYIYIYIYNIWQKCKCH